MGKDKAREKKPAGAGVSQPGINSEVNACLRLAPLPKFPAKDHDPKRVVLLVIGKRCPALEFLAERARSSPKEYKKLIQLLRKLAENEEIPELDTIKPVGSHKQLLQLDGNKNARLYCFQEGDVTVVCTSGFWIGSGSKKKSQNLEIESAEELMNRWRKARPVDGQEDTREVRDGESGHG